MKNEQNEKNKAQLGGSTDAADEADRSEVFKARAAQKYAAWSSLVRERLSALLKLYRAVQEKSSRALSLLDYLREEENAKSIRLAKKEASRAVKEVLPKKGGGYLKLGFGDPFLTGKAMEAAALFYPLYGRHIEVIPSFEEPVLETKLHVRGRIHLCVLIYAGLRILFDRNLRQIYRHVRKEAGCLTGTEKAPSAEH